MEVGGVGNPGIDLETHSRTDLHKTSIEFEGILLATLLQSWQHAGPFSEDEEQPAGNDTLQSVAIQATGNALAKRGQLGIAKMVERSLTAHR